MQPQLERRAQPQRVEAAINVEEDGGRAVPATPIRRPGQNAVEGALHQQGGLSSAPLAEHLERVPGREALGRQARKQRDWQDTRTGEEVVGGLCAR